MNQFANSKIGSVRHREGKGPERKKCIISYLLRVEPCKPNLETALRHKFGRSDLTILEIVRATFPSTTLYLNAHGDNIPLLTEDEYFNRLDVTDTIGYEKWDGTPGNPSLPVLRRLLLKTFHETPENDH